MTKAMQTKISQLEAELYDNLDLAEQAKEQGDLDTFNTIMDEDVMPLFDEIRVLETVTQ